MKPLRQDKRRLSTISATFIVLLATVLLAGCAHQTAAYGEADITGAGWRFPA